MAFELPKLPFEYNALEPHLDAQTMEIHYSKHHQGYVNKLNAVLEGKDGLLTKPVEQLLKEISSVPEEIRQKVTNLGGGVANHTFYWHSMKPGGGGEPTGAVADSIKESFGSFESFKEKFTKAAVTFFGSGWAWLVQKDGKLAVTGTLNQDSPLSIGQKPLLNIDVWEHAYYLKYQNRRNEFVDAWWNVVNWEEVEKRLKE
jgi:Fe-Mn family superoxide dismutase